MIVTGSCSKMWSLVSKFVHSGCIDCARAFSTSSSRLRIWKGQPEWEGGIKHHGFTYYPRPGQVDPIIKPSKLYMVQRIQRLIGQPYWVKDIITKLKLDGDRVDKAVVKNTPEMNALLWQVKHVVKIIPITYPYGEPKEGDQGHLNDKGQFILTRKINADVDENRLEASYKFFKDPVRINSDTIKKKLRRKWLTGEK